MAILEINSKSWLSNCHSSTWIHNSITLHLTPTLIPLWSSLWSRCVLSSIMCYFTYISLSNHCIFVAKHCCHLLMNTEIYFHSTRPLSLVYYLLKCFCFPGHKWPLIRAFMISKSSRYTKYKMLFSGNVTI